MLAGGGALVAAGAVAAAARRLRAPAAREPARPLGPLLEALGAGGTFPVSVAPSGRHLLVKVLGRASFELRVVERESGRVVASDASPDTQLAPTWHDDGRRLAFLQDEGGDGAYRLYSWDALAGGARRPVDAPPTTTTALRWAPAGERLAYLQTRQGSAKRELVTVGSNGDPPARAVVDDVAPRTGFIWSPEGERLATVERGRPGAIAIARAAGGPVQSLRLSGGLEPRALAWSPDGRSLLVTGRAPGDEFSGLYEVDVEGGAARALVRGEGADRSGPLYAAGGKARLYHENADGELHLWALDAGGARRLGPGEGNAIVSGLDAAGGVAWVLYTARARPPALLEVPLDGAAGGTVFASERRAGLPEAAAERDEIGADDGLRLPLYVWRARAPAGGALGALVRVHGGLYSQSTRGWQQAVDVLVAAGVHVVSVNFRGSSGYGARHEEAPGGDEARARDVLRAAAYARERLGVPEGRVWLWGHSHGAFLAAIAATLDGGRLGGLVAVSASFAGALPRGGRPRRVLGFHGAADPLVSPERARAALASIAGGPGGLRPSDRFETFEREGHNFSRGATWQRVYGVLLEAMREGAG